MWRRCKRREIEGEVEYTYNNSNNKIDKNNKIHDNTRYDAAAAAAAAAADDDDDDYKKRGRRR